MTPPDSNQKADGAPQGGHVSQAAAAGIAVEHCRTWLAWAVAQIDCCLAEDKPACDRLLESLAAAMRSERLEADARMAAVIVAVQSHDRVMQRVAHARDALRLLLEQLGDPRRAESDESWRALRERQLRQFSMAEERVLFMRLVHKDEGWQEVAVNPDETVELFIAADGFGES